MLLLLLQLQAAAAAAVYMGLDARRCLRAHPSTCRSQDEGTSVLRAVGGPTDRQEEALACRSLELAFCCCGIAAGWATAGTAVPQTYD